MGLGRGKKVCVDYAEKVWGDDDNDKRIDLSNELRNNLEAARKTDFDVVAFSHLDQDHTCGASEFFYFDHDEKYQSEERIKIAEMWVPAAVLIEKKDTLGDEHKIIQAEARHRLCNKKGIRVFSRPGMLKVWLEPRGMTLHDVVHMMM